jgi:hypothetical protein
MKHSEWDPKVQELGRLFFELENSETASSRVSTEKEMMLLLVDMMEMEAFSSPGWS